MAKKNCILCGTEFEEGQSCPSNHVFKKMCINCSHCVADKEGNKICGNEENKKNALEKMKAAVAAASGGYEIEAVDIKVKPLVLKKPLSCCQQWTLSERVIEMIKQAFK